MRKTLQFWIDDPRVADLQKWLERRIFAIPQLQREFVWNGKKAAKLFDSIYRGITIGPLLVWKTSSENSDWLRPDLNLLPTFNREANDSVWYLIDGQQRLTVLYQAALGQVKKNSNGREVDFGRITFALDPYDNNEETFAYRHVVEGRYVPVADILSKHWRHLFSKYGQAKKEKIKGCRETLLNYRVPILFINTSNIEDVRDTFLRINSGGTRVTAADEAFARASRFNLRAHVCTLRSSLPGFEGLDPNAILQGFSFVCGKRDVGKKVTQATVKDWENVIRYTDGRPDFDKVWNDYSSAVAKAVNFLRQEFCVHNLDFLPSENMLAVLPFFFYKNGAYPVSAQRRELRKWFWATAVGNRYSGRGHRRNMVADVRFLEKLARQKYSHFPHTERVPVSEIARTQYTPNTSLGNAFFCLLASRKPRRLLADGEIPVDIVAGRSDKRNKHHVFPKDLLQKLGFATREYNSLCNICFLPAEENQSVGTRPPWRYLGQLRGARGFPSKMNSHLIPQHSGCGIWLHDLRRGFKQFRRERLAAIRRVFKAVAGIELFRDER